MSIRLPLLALRCTPCKDPFRQPPDYTLPGMSDPAAPENMGKTKDELGNICSLCLQELDGPPDDGLPDDLERIKSSNHQFHRWCLAHWVWTHETDPLDPSKRINQNEVEGLLIFRPNGVNVWPIPPRVSLLAEAFPGDNMRFEALANEDHDIKIYRNGEGGWVLVGWLYISYMSFFEGARGEEFEVRREYGTHASPWRVDYFQGLKGTERLVQRDEPLDGTKQFFQGRRGQESLIRFEYQSGEIEHYRGPRNEEHRVLEERDNGEKRFYHGARGEERLVRIEHEDGGKDFFNGPDERLVRRDLPDGSKWFYTGEAGEERKYALEADGDRILYKGPSGEERKVAERLASGTENYYKGAAGEERLVRSEHANGFAFIYSGQRGAETIIDTLVPKGPDSDSDGDGESDSE